MSTIELIVSVLAILFVIVLLSSVGHYSYLESKLSNKLPKPKSYPPCPPYNITYDHKIFENNVWTTAICYGTSDEISEQMSEWDKITDKNLAEYKKSAKIRDIIALRKKLKERHNA